MVNCVKIDYTSSSYLLNSVLSGLNHKYRLGVIIGEKNKNRCTLARKDG
mgnify:CR=1 FL=1